jgi:hypothetical protein
VLVYVAFRATLFVSGLWAWCVVGALAAAAATWLMKKDYGLSWLIVFGFPVVVFLADILLTRTAPPRRFFLAVSAWGVLFLLDGSISLIRYVLQNPLPGRPPA